MRPRSSTLVFNQPPSHDHENVRIKDVNAMCLWFLIHIVSSSFTYKMKQYGQWLGMCESLLKRLTHYLVFTWVLEYSPFVLQISFTHMRFNPSFGTDILRSNKLFSFIKLTSNGKDQIKLTNYFFFSKLTKWSKF